MPFPHFGQTTFVLWSAIWCRKATNVSPQPGQVIVVCVDIIRLLLPTGVLGSPRSFCSRSYVRNAVVLVSTVVADRLTTPRTSNSMLLASGRFPAVHAGQGYGITLDGILPRAIAFGNNVDFTAEFSGFFGWHSVTHYNARRYEAIKERLEERLWQLPAPSWRGGLRHFVVRTE